MTISMLGSGSARVSMREANSITCGFAPCLSYVTQNGDGLVAVAASNPGGLKRLHVDIERLSTTEPAVSVEVIAANGTVPKTLGIIGHNGRGGIGPNPILYHADPHDSNGLRVTAYAESFAGKTARASALLLPLPRLKVSLKADPTTLIIGQDHQTILTYACPGASSAQLVEQTVNPALDSTIPNPRRLWRITPERFTLSDTGGSASVPLLRNDTGTLLKIQQDTVFTLTASNFLYDECTLPVKTRCAGAQRLTTSVRVNVNAPTTTTTTTPSSGNLTIDYKFRNVGLSGYDQTVDFSGQLIKAAAGSSGGVTQFSKIVTSHVDAATTGVVTCRQTGLAAGKWSVNATPRGGPGPRTCNVFVPGVITLDVSESDSAKQCSGNVW